MDASATDARLDDPQVFLPDLFAAHARSDPGRDAVVCGDRRLSWGAFDEAQNRVANALLSLGLAKGDKVALLLGNAVETPALIYGAVRAGACVVPLSGLLTAEQVGGLIADSGARFAVMTGAFREAGEAARPAAPAVERWLAAGFEGAGWESFDALMAAAATTHPPVRHAMTDAFNIIYSSGTTGLPKGIVQTHRARTHWAFSNASEMGFAADCRALTTTALYSNGTWLMMLPALFAGGTLQVMPSFDGAAFLRTVEAERITHTFMVPAQIIMTLERPELPAADLSSLQAVLSGGSPLRRDTKREAMARISPRLFELYGYSEGFATMLRPDQHAAKFETVGTPVLGFEIVVLREDGTEAAPGEPGEIAGYGAGIMAGYHGRPEATEEIVWRDRLGRTFLRSGDIGSLDEDGCLVILDRKKDMIISGGFNVFPSDVEEIVGAHPDVGDVTVIGVPH
ncbi:MAG: class I adenylate-forming enzyme family protein, partial [Pseudomonadota bacterium]